MNASEPRKVTGADGPAMGARGQQIATSAVSDPSQDLQAARVEAAARAMYALDRDLEYDDSWEDARDLTRDLLREQAAAALAAADAVQVDGSWICGRCGNGSQAHARSECIYDPVFKRVQLDDHAALVADDQTRKLRDASRAVRKSEQHWPADCLDEAAETIDILRAAIVDRDEALAEVERIRAGNDRLTKAYVTSEVALSDMEEERDAAIAERDAQSAAVLALADEYATSSNAALVADQLEVAGTLHGAASRLRALVTDPYRTTAPTEEVDQ